MKPTTARPLTEIRRHALIYPGLLPFVAIALFPVLWMAITAFAVVLEVRAKKRLH